MLITTSNDPSESLKPSHVALLREECDDVKTFSECGWFCVVGYKGTNRLVYAHCDSRKDYETAMGILKRPNPYGYGADGGGYLIAATATYTSGDDTSETSTLYFSSEIGHLGEDRRKELVNEHFREAGEDEIRCVRFRGVYWDELPRHAEVVPAEAETSAAPGIRY